MPKAKAKTNRPCSSDEENEDQQQVGEVVLRTNSNDTTNDSHASRANVDRPNAPTNAGNVRNVRVTFDSDEFESIPFYDLPCSQNLRLNETDLSNIKFWLKSGTIDERDLPYLKSIVNLDEESKIILAGWEAALNIARYVNEGLGEIETISRKREIDRLICSPPSTVDEHGGNTLLDDNLVGSSWENDPGAGPSNALDAFSDENEPVGASDVSASTSSLGYMGGSDSESDFQARGNRPNKRKRKQKGKGVGPAKKRKVVPVKSKHPFNWLRKKDGVKNKLRYLAKNKAKREKIRAQKQKTKKANAFLKLLRRVQRKKDRDLEKTENKEMDKLMKIELHREKHNTKYKATEKDFKITFQDMDAVSFSETLELVSRLIERVLARLLKDVEPHHKVRLVLRSPELDAAIQIPFTRKKDLHAREVIDYIVRVLNSNQSFHIHPGIILNVIHVAVPRGGTRKRVKSFDPKKILKDKRSVITINNKDDLCFGRALAVAKCHALKENNDEKARDSWDSLRRYDGPQKAAAEALYDAAGVKRGRCGVPEMQKFQEFLAPDFGINVFQLNMTPGEQHIFRGRINAPMQLYIAYYKEHFDTITSITGFLDRSFFCNPCGIGFNDTRKHMCTRPECYSCFHSSCRSTRKIPKDIQSYLECNECHRFFRDAYCL